MKRVFDKDGNDITPQPPPIEEMEYICEIGGVFEESRVSLEFRSDKLDKDRVTKALGVQPTESWNPDEKRPLENSDNFVSHTRGIWVLSTERDDRNIEDKITELFKLCSGDMRNWEDIANDYTCMLAICLYGKNWNRELLLSPDILTEISKRKLTLWVDVYFETDDEEAGSEETDSAD